MLLEKITPEKIQVGIKAVDWEDAIKQSSQPLLNNKSIEETYVNAIIDSVNENGPYFVITKHIALAHARPEFGVNKVDVSFTVLADSIEFGSEAFDPIKLIITLAAIDSDSHLELLSELTDVLTDEEALQALYKSKTSNDFYDILKSCFE